MDVSAEFLKWLPQGGAAGAVIFVVFLFLKQQDKMSETLIMMTDKFKTTLEGYLVSSDAKLKLLTDKYQERFIYHEEQYGKLHEQVAALVREQVVSNTKLADCLEKVATQSIRNGEMIASHCQGTAKKE